MKKSRVADPNHFNADPDPAFHSNADPDTAGASDPDPQSTRSDGAGSSRAQVTSK